MAEFINAILFADFTDPPIQDFKSEMLKFVEFYNRHGVPSNHISAGTINHLYNLASETEPYSITSDSTPPLEDFVTELELLVGLYANHYSFFSYISNLTMYRMSLIYTDTPANSRLVSVASDGSSVEASFELSTPQP